jgi:hypothetical protein
MELGLLEFYISRNTILNNYYFILYFWLLISQTIFNNISFEACYKIGAYLFLVIFKINTLDRDI